MERFGALAYGRAHGTHISVVRRRSSRRDAGRRGGGGDRRTGVRVLAGTDMGNPYVFRGWSLHEELALLAGVERAATR